MLTQYHIEIMRTALSDVFSPRALAKIIEAILDLDHLHGQFGHDEYHFDNNAFEKTYAYLEEQRALTTLSLRANDAFSPWSASGRLTISCRISTPFELHHLTAFPLRWT